MHRSQHQTAFTLIEALIALTIITLLLHSAAPALGALLQRHQLSTLTNSTIRLMSSARLEAISRAQPVTWCPLNSQNKCDTEQAKRLVTFADINNNQKLDEDETLLAQATLASDQKVTMANKDTVRFIANGRTYQPTSIYLCEGELARKITVSFTGRIYQYQTGSPLNCPD